MNFLKPDLMRSFGIGFVLGCVALVMTMDFGPQQGGVVVPSAIAAPVK